VNYKKKVKIALEAYREFVGDMSDESARYLAGKILEQECIDRREKARQNEKSERKEKNRKRKNPARGRAISRRGWRKL